MNSSPLLDAIREQHRYIEALLNHGSLIEGRNECLADARKNLDRLIDTLITAASAGTLATIHSRP